jgi:SlyX protein
MDARLTHLETKLAFQDDLLESLNHVVAQQQQQIDMLQQQVQMLYNQLRAIAPSDIAMPEDDTRPPHY